MLRKRVPGKRIFLEPAEKKRLMELGQTIGAGEKHLITVVSYSSYLRWIRQAAKGHEPKKISIDFKLTNCENMRSSTVTNSPSGAVFEMTWRPEPTLPVRISCIATRGMSIHQSSDESSRGKVPNVLSNSRARTRLPPWSGRG